MSLWDDLGFGEGKWLPSGDPKKPLGAPSAVAKDLAEYSKIVIAADGTYSRSSRYPGIELLLWLRLREKYTGPILLVGFQPAEAILAAHPEHLVLLAPGNHYERLPISEATKSIVMGWLARDNGLTKENIAEKYKPYLSSAFDIATFRHRMANIYGLKVMWDALRIRESSPQLPYPGLLSKLREGDLQVRIGSCLYDPEDKPGAGRRVTVHVPVMHLIHVDDDAGLGWSEIFQRLVKGTSQSSGTVKSIDLQETARKNSDIDKIVSDVVGQAQALAQSKDALLLDLSLYPRHDAQAKDIESMSGAKVLTELRKLNRSIPIMVTTASNKIWAYEDVMRLGADCYWVKPGVEDAWTNGDVSENMERLCRFLVGSQQDMVKVRKDLEGALWWLSGLSKGHEPWWSMGKWPDDYTRTAQPARVKDMLDNILHQLSMHNQRFTYDDRKVNKLNERRSLASIAMTAGVLFEYIVGTVFSSMKEDDRRYKNDNRLQVARVGREFRDAIMDPRGMATHSQDRGDIKPENVVTQIQALCRFIQSTERGRTALHRPALPR